MLLIGVGNQGALSELYARYSKKLLFYFSKSLNYNQDRAEDMLHDLFMKIIDKPALFNSNQKFTTWIYQVATNMCRNEWRNTSNQLRILEQQKASFTGEPSLYGQQIDHGIFKQHLQSVYEELKEEERLIFVLRFHLDLPLKEIASVLNCPEGTVKSRIYYLLKKLAIQLKHFKPQ